MSAWTGKTVIGLTGNIATGKSVVRKMLEHLGAYGIDADALSHRAIAIGAPGYQPVVETFGKWILAPDGQIDRSKLAKIVFSDPVALKKLENIIHPLVRQAEDLLIRRTDKPVVVVEAIKLIESGFDRLCDQVWVTYAPEDVQLRRLMTKRGMSREAALQRILAQPPQEEKLQRADVVIRNDRALSETWQQVLSAWKNLLLAKGVEWEEEKAAPGGILVERAKPSQAGEIAAFLQAVLGKNLSPNEVMEAFGEKAFLLLRRDGVLRGILGWRVENLIARVDDVFISDHTPLEEAVTLLIREVERASKELQCEAALLFLAEELKSQQELWRKLGYQEIKAGNIGVRAWQEAALEVVQAEDTLWLKRLREDLVLKPV
ncbi:MAG: dephospho-CoA kinase [Anaerolineales bacterium]|nr:dephospho-CoA kinase [Anaerolineales bacterium]MCS7246954.1 dephospho-CoA kinase [Anaerolineales bacterium]MDW8160765.1 dephospho-CoA kinase [Anaerolineales bacterium]MDW8447688.1 dephospho-CoA kinase [Anaerolineales bacterium]